MAIGVGPDDHVAVVVGFQIGDLTQQGDAASQAAKRSASHAAVIAFCSIWWRWAGSSGMLTLLEGAVGDPAQQARVVLQGADMAPCMDGPCVASAELGLASGISRPCIRRR